MYWFKWRCHANDAGVLYRVIIIDTCIRTVNHQNKKLSEIVNEKHVWQQQPASAHSLFDALWPFAVLRLRNILIYLLTYLLLSIQLIRPTQTFLFGSCDVLLPALSCCQPLRVVSLLHCSLWIYSAQAVAGRGSCIHDACVSWRVRCGFTVGWLVAWA